MRDSLLQSKAPAARMGEYYGAHAAAVFSNVASEFEALRSHAAVYEAPWRAKIVVTGEDRIRWLNGMITNNVRDLAPGHGVYSFVLSAQGRIQGDLTAYHRSDYLLLVTEETQAAKLTELFERYVIMDDVEITNVSEKLASMGMKGPGAADVLRRAGFSIPDVLCVVDQVWNGVGTTIARGFSERFPEYEIWFAPENTASVWDALVTAGAEPVGFDALELFRIASGAPSYGQDIRERELPQETAQTHALHFAKGCYIGQEIVERIRSRGGVHRTFTGFKLSAAVPAGTKLHKDGKELGELTSVAVLPSQDVIALGYVRREVDAPGTQLTAGDSTATVNPIPFEM